MKGALKRAGKPPRIIYTDKLRAYLVATEVVPGRNKHVHGNPFDVENNTNLIERFHSTLKSRTEIMRGMQNQKTAELIMDGWLIYYNFFSPRMSLDGRTPAEAAKADYPYYSWLDGHGRKGVDATIHPKRTEPTRVY